ncbi:MAG: UPF0755 protein [Rickettsiales bacterium]|jgi:UPF0755 protein
MYFNAPNSYHMEDKKFIIENGQTFRQVVEQLHKEHIVRHPASFLYIAQLVKGYNPTVRYGEYFFEKNLSFHKMMHKMIKGYVSFRKFTIAEGLSSNSVLKIVGNSHGLIGEVPENIPEGSVLPETYFYSYNDSKSLTIKRMQLAMQKTIDDLWETRDPTIPVKTKAQAIILASIVEKETGNQAERGTVASVFTNRLRIGMKLQSDPTIIYSFTFGDTGLERSIRRKDIRNNSKFNTYHIYGLPPTPICNPGIDSIKAVLNPPTTKYLYFVATGRNGTHIFSSNLRDHNRSVSKYYQTLREKAAKKRANNASKLTPTPEIK